MEALTEKREALECLQGILEEENALITGLDTEGLQINSSRKLQVLERITTINNRCRTALADACREIGGSGGSTLSPLLAWLNQPEKDNMRALQKTILGVAKNNERLIELNKSLLESSLGLVNRSLMFFAKFLTSGGTYGQAGRMIEAPAGAWLFRKEM
jgi:hypothetical protein